MSPFGEWDYAATGPLRRPATLTLGILGLGRIGRQLAALARPSFKAVLGHDPHLSSSCWPEGVAPRDLESLFRESDCPKSRHRRVTRSYGIPGSS
jgi:D-3-phosphoglycerate dehydrogenase